MYVLSVLVPGKSQLDNECVVVLSKNTCHCDVFSFYFVVYDIYQCTCTRVIDRFCRRKCTSEHIVFNILNHPLPINYNVLTQIVRFDS